MKNYKKIGVFLLSLLTIGTFSSFPNVVNAQNEGFTATELSSSKTIVVDGEEVNIEEKEIETVYVAEKLTSSIGEADGEKDDAYNNAYSIPINETPKVNGNESPATGTMYLLWDESYLYVFAEIVDKKVYDYSSDSDINKIDSFELMIDLYHESDYWLGGYGGEYRNEWYGNGAQMCEGSYRIAAGSNKAVVDSSIIGSHYMWDAQKNNGSYFSKKTDIGYTVEFKISVGVDALTYLKANREIGVGVKLYDKYIDNAGLSVSTIEEINYLQANSPRYLSNVILSQDNIEPTERNAVLLEGRDEYSAVKTRDYIIADGIKDDAWNNAKAIDLIYVRQFANENVGRMRVSMLWDEDYFYLFAEIEDNTINSCPTSDVFNYNNYDSVGFCLDLLRDTTVSNFDTGDYKTSVGFGGDYRGEPGPMCEGFWAVTRGAKDLTIGTHWMCDDPNTKAKSSFASISDENGYTVEMKLYAGNDKELFMQEGRKIGVGLNVSDQFVNNGNSSSTVSHAVLDEKNFPNNDRAFGKVWAQGPSALSEVTLDGYSENDKFVDDGVERNCCSSR